VLFDPALASKWQGGTPASFSVVLYSVTTNEAQWHKLIESVDIEGLPISYAVGKQLEQNKTIVRQDLDMVVLWAPAVAKNKNSPYDEVNFMSATQELQSQLQEFLDLLLSDAPTDAPLCEENIQSERGPDDPGEWPRKRYLEDFFPLRDKSCKATRPGLRAR
jgi:hypothetical protein